MKDTETAQVGDSGELHVAAQFSDLGWAPVLNSRRDLGTDLFVQVRDSRRFDLGLFIGVHVKSGPSWFDRPERDDEGAVVGWWHYEEGAQHFGDWVTHGLPHLLVLYDVATRDAYWVHVTSGIVSETGEGAKILVPRTQTIDGNWREALVDAAATQRQTISFEGSIGSRGSKISPDSLLRHALIAPRLVAPHRSDGFSRKPSPEQAAGLLIDCRLDDLYYFREHHPSIPQSASAAMDSKEWRWRFVGAIETALTGDGIGELDVIRGKARRPDRRAAAHAFYAAMLLQDERFEEVEALLAEPDVNWHSVDFSWACILRAVALSEIGRTNEARESAVDALRSIGGRTDDVTASAIRASAATLIFYSEDQFRGDDAAKMLVANDTVVSWWRNQRISNGLGSSTRTAYRRIFDDRSHRFGGLSNPGHNHLMSAMLTACCAGDWGAYQRALALLGMNHALGSDDSTSEAVASIDALRRSSSRKETNLQAVYLWKWGDSDRLREAVQSAITRGWSHSSASASLALIEDGGDVLDHGTANYIANNLVDIALDTAAFVQRVRPTFMVVLYVLEALSGVVRAAEPHGRASIAGFLCDLPPIEDSARVGALYKVARRLVNDPAVAHMADRFAEAALRQPDRRFSACLLENGIANSQAAQEEAFRRIGQGDRYAMDAVSDVRKLSPGAAQKLAKRDATTIRRMRAEAGKGSYTVRVHDPAQSLAILGAWFPDVANWDLLLRFLTDGRVPGTAKRGCCIALSHLIDKLPPEIREKLAEIAPRLSGGFEDFFGDSFGGAGVYLTAALGALNEDELAPRLVGLLGGAGAERADAVLMAGRLARQDLHVLPTGLLRDSDPAVREAAAAGLAMHLIMSGDDTSPLAVEAAAAVIRGPGCVQALRIANAFINVESNTVDRYSSLLRSLSVHPSALVRSRAKEVLAIR